MNNTAKLSISPNVIKLLGRKLYASHPLPIVVRELLQNSVDACNRRKIAAKIKIEIKQSGDTIDVICTDNGEGMSQDVLLNKFLCLGESGKRDNTDSVGGFGIAKAAIMSNPFWDVHTHDMYTSSELLGEPLQDRYYLDGTKVKVTIDETWYSSTIHKALTMIYLSSVTIHLIFTQNGIVLIDDTKAGLNKKSSLDRSTDDYNIRLLESFKPIDNTEYSLNVENYDIFRLNGLVQFIQFSYNRPINVIVDLKTNLLPTDKDYPLSMSRESVESSIRYAIQKRINHFNENPLSTESSVSRISQNSNEILQDGLMLCADTSYNDNVNLDSLPAIGKLQCKIIGEKPTTKQKRILRLWAGILSLVTDDNEVFSIGITDEGSAIAYREGDGCYVLKIDYSYDDFTMDALIHRLTVLAIHEALHFSLGSHNEHFTSALDDKYSNKIQIILDNMPKLRAIVRGNYR